MFIIIGILNYYFMGCLIGILIIKGCFSGTFRSFKSLAPGLFLLNSFLTFLLIGIYNTPPKTNIEPENDALVRMIFQDSSGVLYSQVNQPLIFRGICLEAEKSIKRIIGRFLLFIREMVGSIRKKTGCLWSSSVFFFDQHLVNEYMLFSHTFPIISCRNINQLGGSSHEV